MWENKNSSHIRNFKMFRLIKSIYHFNPSSPYFVSLSLWCLLIWQLFPQNWANVDYHTIILTNKRFFPFVSSVVKAWKFAPFTSAREQRIVVERLLYSHVKLPIISKLERVCFVSCLPTNDYSTYTVQL